MKTTIKIQLALALVFCFAIVAVNSNIVLADDAVELDILKKVKKIKSLINKEVIPRLDECCGDCPVGVPKTGQTFSYAPGDDGDLEKGLAWPVPRFTDNGDGTVTDNLTRLIWLKNASCLFGDVVGIPRTWADALSVCNSLASGTCGLTDGSSAGDWRLPNIRELLSLVDFMNEPALPDGHPFVEVSDTFYWSSTTHWYWEDWAWYVFFTYGLVGYGGQTIGGVAFDKDDLLAVWPVRDGN